MVACSTSSEPSYTIITNYPATDPPHVYVPAISVQPPVVDGSDIGPRVPPASTGADSGFDSTDVVDASAEGDATGDAGPANGLDVSADADAGMDLDVLDTESAPSP